MLIIVFSILGGVVLIVLVGCLALQYMRRVQIATSAAQMQNEMFVPLMYNNNGAAPVQFLRQSPGLINVGEQSAQGSFLVL